jgi:hypothetical protein
MKMKRGLLLSMSALALTVVGASVQAQTPVVNISLNLRYTDPNNTAAGGRWYLAAKTSDSRGIAGLSAYISGIDTTGIAFGSTAIGSGGAAYETVTGATLGANVATPGNTPFNTTIGSAVNVVYGQNNAVGGAIVPGVGTATFAGRQDVDPLRNTATWNNSTILMSGTFGATRPAFVANVGTASNNTDANILGSTTVLGTPAVDADVTLTVRGDSVSIDGLLPGDANRDRIVNAADFSALSANFNQNNTTWDQGNFNSSTVPGTNAADFSALSARFGQSSPAPAAAAIPEPSALALVGIGLLALGYRVKRN